MGSTLSTKPSRFLNLPAELRHKIYTHLVHHPFPIDLTSTSRDFTTIPELAKTSHLPIRAPCFPHGLLLTCVQIYHELRTLYFSINTFSITISRSLTILHPFLTPEFQKNRRQIRSLRLINVRWGRFSGFGRDLAPLIEDCIMNGRLRELEVIVKRAEYLRRNEGNGQKNKELESWNVLRRIFANPYLKKAALKVGDWRDSEGFIVLLDGEEVPLM